MTKQPILRAQGAYYVASGLWPIFSMRSFERFTGPKVDKWLVQMVGLLAASIGVTLLIASRKEEVEESVVALSIASASSFAVIDVVHVARRRISPIYLGDAIVEAAVTVLLAIAA